MSAYDKFSDRFRKSAAQRATPPKTPKIPKDGVTLDGLDTLGGVPLKVAISVPAEVIAPQALAGAPQLKDEPPYDQPCFARRGRVERKGGAFLHFWFLTPLRRLADELAKPAALRHGCNTIS
jgi:hypothetical protein